MLTYWDLTEPHKISFVSAELLYLKLSAKQTEMDQVTGERRLRSEQRPEFGPVNYTQTEKTRLMKGYVTIREVKEEQNGRWTVYWSTKENGDCCWVLW